MNDNQLRLITDEEYNDLLSYKKHWNCLTKKLNEVSKELYNKPYYLGPSPLTVAYEQINDMYFEIKHSRLPWYKKYKKL